MVKYFMRLTMSLVLLLTACENDPQPVQLTFEAKDSTVVMKSYSSAGELDAWKWIDRIIAIITGLSVTVGSGVAIYGIISWRRQRRGEDAYNLSRKLRNELIYLSSEFSENRKYPAPTVRTQADIDALFMGSSKVAKWQFYGERAEKISARTEAVRSVFYELQPLGCGLDDATMRDILWYMRQYIDRAAAMDQLRYDIDLGIQVLENLQPADEYLLNVYHANYTPPHLSDFGKLVNSAFGRIFPNLQEIIDGTRLRKRIRVRLRKMAQWIKDNSQSPS